MIKELQGLSLRKRRSHSNERQQGYLQGIRRDAFHPLWSQRSGSVKCQQLCGKGTEEGPLTLSIDLKPALTEEQLDARILRDFEESMNKQFKMLWAIYILPS